MNNTKRNMRYHNPDDDVIKLSFDNGKSKKNAIVVNESHTGIACIYVGDPVSNNQTITWIETENIFTDCVVMRCEELKEKVFFLAFEISPK